MNKILLTAAILLMLILTSYSFANFLTDKKFNDASMVSEEIKELKLMFEYNETVYNKLDNIDQSVGFLISVCMD